MSESSISLRWERLRRWWSQKSEGRRLRREVSGDEFCLADRLEYLRPDHWKSVVGQRLLFSPEYLGALEEAARFSSQPFLQFRYALIYREGRPLAALNFQILSLNLGESSKLTQRIPPRAREFFGQVRPRILVCGNLLAINESGICLAQGSSDAWPIHAIAEVIYRLRRAEKLSGQTDLVLLKDLPAESESLPQLQQFGYRGIQTEPDMVLEFAPSWKSYADYLGQLNSKYRKTVRQLHKSVEKAGFQVHFERAIGRLGERIHQLYLQVLGNADFRPVSLPESFHPCLERGLGPNFCCIQMTDKDGQLVGFLSMLRDGESAIAYYVGFDREAALQAPLYLRLLHASIEQAFAWGCRRVAFGRTALDPKSRLGALPVTRRSWARYRLPQINWLLRGLWSAVPHPTAPERNPFAERASAADEN